MLYDNQLTNKRTKYQASEARRPYDTTKAPTTPEGIAERHRQIARFYTWAKRERCRPGDFLMKVRLRELEDFWRWCYGDSLPNDGAGRDDLYIAINIIAAAYPDIECIVEWANVWASWCPRPEVEKLAERALASPHVWKADTLAWRIGLPDAVRKVLKITTIGAIDMNKQKRATRGRANKRLADAERSRANRRAQGAKPHAESASRTKPWEAFGISRSTWERRGKPQPETEAAADENPSPEPADENSSHSRLFLRAGRRICGKAQAARPQGGRRQRHSEGRASPVCSIQLHGGKVGLLLSDQTIRWLQHGEAA
jgi:hypothetical protein